MSEERDKGLARLREAFPPEHVGKLPRANITLDYVGHGAVTDRLLEVDPLWNWEPAATDERGLPLFDLDAKGNPVGLWIRLTILGVTRLGFGSCNGGQFDAEKVLIGDAIRNAAMRFGVALDLWIKGSAEDDEKVAASDTRQRPSRTKQEDPPEIARLKELNRLLTPDQKTAYKDWRREQEIPDENRSPEQIEDCITFLETLTKAPAA